MPKMKTHSGAKKRFKVTATGKVRGRHPFTSHILEKKSPKKKRALGAPKMLHEHDVPRVKRMLGGRQMTRVKRSVHARKKRRATLEQTKGFRGEAHSNYKRAKEALLKADAYAYRDRRNRKRDFRRLWITRINAAARINGMSYSQFMHGLTLAGVELDRKVLADIAVRDADTFRRFAEVAREASAACLPDPGSAGNRQPTDSLPGVAPEKDGALFVARDRTHTEQPHQMTTDRLHHTTPAEGPAPPAHASASARASGRFLAEGEDLIAAAARAGRQPLEGYRLAGSRSRRRRLPRCRARRARGASRRSGRARA